MGDRWVGLCCLGQSRSFDSVKTESHGTGQNGDQGRPVWSRTHRRFSDR